MLLVVGVCLVVVLVVSSSVSFVLTFFLVMGAVAFYTLLERKLLGYFQVRLGPNKVGLKGVPQPIADAVKLFLKEFLFPHGSNKAAFMFGPALMLILCLGVWVLYPVLYKSVYCLWGFLLFVCVSSAGVYGVIVVGWSSDSGYTYSDCMWAVAQFISYEVVMVMIILVTVIIVGSFDLGKVNGLGVMGVLVLVPMFLMWLVSVLAETNRAPFDFVEGESELVSGFNVEFGGVGFALIFIAEYSMILFMSILTVVLYAGGVSLGVLFSGFLSLLVAGFIVLCRGGLPRFRYDLLMMLTWKYFLPVVLLFLAISVVLV